MTAPEPRNTPQPPDDLHAKLNALVSQLLEASNARPSSPSVVHIHTSEVDVSPDPTGAALTKAEAEINDASRRAAETAAKRTAPEVVSTPDAIGHEAVEIQGLTPLVVDAVGPDLEAQAREAREARKAIDELKAAGKHQAEALESLKRAGGLLLEAAQKRFYKAALEYHRFSLAASVIFGAVGVGMMADPRGFVVNIAAMAFGYGLAKLKEKRPQASKFLRSARERADHAAGDRFRGSGDDVRLAGNGFQGSGDDVRPAEDGFRGSGDDVRAPDNCARRLGCSGGAISTTTRRCLIRATSTRSCWCSARGRARRVGCEEEDSKAFRHEREVLCNRVGVGEHVMVSPADGKGLNRRRYEVLMKTMCVRALVAVAVGCGGAALGQTCSSPTTLTVTGAYSINGQLRPVLKFREGVNYTFNASAVSGFHPLILTLSPTGGGGSVPLTSSQLFGYNGTPICSACPQTSVTVRPTENTPSEFYYQCNVHMGLGARIVMVRRPLVVLGPESQSVEVGEHVMFGVGVDSNGSDVVMYQWHRNYEPIAGATDAVYMIDNASEADEGPYFCLITNECGDTTASPVATLSVADAACDSLDFNGDSSFFDPMDIDAFLSVFSEGPCIPATATCNDIDFNNDGSLFDPCDIDSFLLVFSEGPCTLCGE